MFWGPELAEHWKLNYYYKLNFSIYKCMYVDVRPNSIKKGVGKMGSVAARSERKIEEKMAK